MQTYCIDSYIMLLIKVIRGTRVRCIVAIVQCVMCWGAQSIFYSLTVLEWDEHDRFSMPSSKTLYDRVANHAQRAVAKRDTARLLPLGICGNKGM